MGHADRASAWEEWVTLKRATRRETAEFGHLADRLTASLSEGYFDQGAGI